MKTQLLFAWSDYLWIPFSQKLWEDMYQENLYTKLANLEP